jgi:hypothetical protein
MRLGKNSLETFGLAEPERRRRILAHFKLD